MDENISKEDGSVDLDISPDMGMYRILPQQSYDYSFALAEFIDNSIQAFNNTDQNILKIDLEIFTTEYDNAKLRNTIIITDDGPGVGSKNLKDAFKPANKTQAHELNEFGIGMKAAAIYFSDHWTMHTRSKGEDEFLIDFDLSKLLEEGEKHVVAKPSEESTLDTLGTRITLHNVRKSINQDSAAVIVQRVSEIYRRFTSRESKQVEIWASVDGAKSRKLRCVVLEDNGVLISPKSVSRTVKGERNYYLVGEKRKWHKDFSFRTKVDGKEYKVKGFIYQLNRANEANNPGISVFRFDRLIVGLTNEKDQFKPRKIFGAPNKHRAQRLYCEVDIDGMPVSYTKDRLDFDVDLLVDGIFECEGVRELVDNAQQYRAEADPSKIIRVNDESEIPAARGKNSNSPKKDTNNSNKKKKRKTKPPKTELDLARQLLTRLRSSDFLTLGLAHFIDELRHQIAQERPIASAVCLRVILEKGLLRKLENDFNDQFKKIEDGRRAGVQKVINHMNGNLKLYFPNNKPRAAAEVVKANSQNLNYADVLLLNNVSHGDYNPEMSMIYKAMNNLQPLLEWIYCTDND